jgi:hypothetical protein
MSLMARKWVAVDFGGPEVLREIGEAGDVSLALVADRDRVITISCPWRGRSSSPMPRPRSRP